MKRIVNKNHLIVLKSASRTVLVSDCLGIRRRENRIHSHTKNIFYHARYHSTQNASVDLKTRVGVGLDQERIELVVKHEIQPKNFKTILFMLRVDLSANRLNQFSRYIFHFFEYWFELELSVGFNISLKFSKCDFIATLKFSILLSFLLNSIVCQVNQFIVKVFQGVLSACCSNVAFFIPISFHTSINGSYQNVNTDVEFSFVVKERIFHILLNNKSARRVTFLTDQRTDFSYRTDDIDAVASVGIFARFADPHIAAFLSFAGCLFIVFAKVGKLRIVNSFCD